DERSPRSAAVSLLVRGEGWRRGVALAGFGGGDRIGRGSRSTHSQVPQRQRAETYDNGSSVRLQTDLLLYACQRSTVMTQLKFLDVSGATPPRSLAHHDIGRRANPRRVKTETNLATVRLRRSVSPDGKDASFFMRLTPVVLALVVAPLLPFARAS